MNIKKYFEIGMMTLLQEKSIDDISVSQLIAEVGSCKGTFYKHYIDKYDLCKHCFDSNIFSEINQDAADWETYVRQHLSVFSKNPTVVSHAMESTDINSIRIVCLEMMVDFMQKEFAKKGGDVKSHLNHSAILHACTSWLAFMMEWLKNGCKEKENEMVDLMYALMPHTVYVTLYQ